jgi:hypothetical protein
MTINNRDKDFILALLKDVRWQTIDKILNEMIDKWNTEQCKKDSEFETIWALAYKEGKVAGLTDFKNLIENLPYD